MWFEYIHFWAMDVFSMGLPQGYISNPIINQLIGGKLPIVK
jgi:hypothetical protein